MRRSRRIVIDMMGDRAAATDMVGNVFHVGHSSRSCRYVHGCDLKANAVPGFELIGGCNDLDAVLQNLSQWHGFNACAGQLVERLPRLGTTFIQGTIGGLQPTACEFSLR